MDNEKLIRGFDDKYREGKNTALPKSLSFH